MQWIGDRLGQGNDEDIVCGVSQLVTAYYESCGTHRSSQVLYATQSLAQPSKLYVRGEGELR